MLGNVFNKIQNLIIRPPKNGDVVYFSTSYNGEKEKKVLGELVNEGGGEGAIYKFDGNLVAKIYKKIVLEEKQRNIRIKKIRYLIKKRVQGACLPIGILYNDKGYIVGYVMPFVNGENLDFYIKNNCKNGNWGNESVSLSISILKVINELHQNNIILGDINGSNILVENSNKVHFIDTDSYQVDNEPCTVGKTEFTAPEIQDKVYCEFLRTISHENYAIATLLFIIFMRTRKPYDCRNGGTDKENIINGKFPYSLNTDAYNDMIPIGHWLDYWNELDVSIKENFYNSFNNRGKYFAPKDRLSCQQWINILVPLSDKIVSSSPCKNVLDIIDMLKDPSNVSTLKVRKGKQKNMKKNYYITDDDFADNAASRVPICLCLDLSGSMLAIENSEYNSDSYTERGVVEGKPVIFVETNEKTITRIDELRKGLSTFFKAIKENQYAHDGAEIAIIGFNNEPKVLLNFENIEKQEIPELEPRLESNTCIGRAVEMALDLLEKRKNFYKEMGASYNQPFLVVMTDGEDNDNPSFVEQVCKRTRQLVSEKKLTVIPVGIGKDANLTQLENFTSTGAYRLNNLNFEKFFVWLSASASGRSQQSSDTYISTGIEEWEIN